MEPALFFLLGVAASFLVFALCFVPWFRARAGDPAQRAFHVAVLRDVDRRMHRERWARFRHRWPMYLLSVAESWFMAGFFGLLCVHLVTPFLLADFADQLLAVVSTSVICTPP